VREDNLLKRGSSNAKWQMGLSQMRLSRSTRLSTRTESRTSEKEFQNFRIAESKKLIEGEWGEEDDPEIE
jgi:hypothetical protein